jgi:phosphotransferase system HPr-like phosphotransfer protein
MHARAASSFVKVAHGFAASISVHNGALKWQATTQKWLATCQVEN